jgi:hypothetical protein
VPFGKSRLGIAIEANTPLHDAWSRADFEGLEIDTESAAGVAALVQNS